MLPHPKLYGLCRYANKLHFNMESQPYSACTASKLDMWLELCHPRADWGLDHLSRSFLQSLRELKDISPKSQSKTEPRIQLMSLDISCPGLWSHLYTVSYLTINLLKIGPIKHRIYGMTLEQCLTFERYSVNIHWVGGWADGWTDKRMNKWAVLFQRTPVYSK